MSKKKPYREIAKEQHLSLTDISTIIKKHKREQNNEEENIAPVSKNTQALKLFSQNKTPLQVAIELDLKMEEVEKIYKDYWKLKGLDELHKAYVEDIQSNIPSFLEFYRFAKEEGASEQDFQYILQHGSNLHFMEELAKQEAEKFKAALKQKRKVELETNELQKDKKALKNVCNQYQSKKDKISHELEAKTEFLKATEESIRRLTNGEEYTKIKETTKQTAVSILDNHEELLLAAVVTVLIALRNDPNKSILITSFNYKDNTDEFQLKNPNSLMDPVNDPYFRGYVRTHCKSVLQTSRLLYDRILDIIQNRRFQSI
jgi:hypothetical protein